MQNNEDNRLEHKSIITSNGDEECLPNLIVTNIEPRGVNEGNKSKAHHSGIT